jgi:hypothetical protein
MITAPAPITASSSTSAPVKGRLLLDPDEVDDELGAVKGSALEEVDGATPVEVAAIDGGSQLL